MEGGAEATGRELLTTYPLQIETLDICAVIWFWLTRLLSTNPKKPYSFILHLTFQCRAKYDFSLFKDELPQNFSISFSISLDSLFITLFHTFYSRIEKKTCFITLKPPQHLTFLITKRSIKFQQFFLTIKLFDFNENYFYVIEIFHSQSDYFFSQALIAYLEATRPC